MSDIAMRFDGIFALAALALGAAAYLCVGLVALAVAGASRKSARRARTVAKRAALLGAATALLFGLLLAVWAQAGTDHAGADWLDLLAIPTGVAFVAGCWWLGRPW